MGISFFKLPWSGKLRTLLEYAEISEDVFSSMLEVNKGITHRLLNGEISKNSNKEVFQMADHLLSILSYILRLASHEPKLMPKYGQVKHLFSGSISQPPWDNVGPVQYLKELGRNGILKSFKWIREEE